MDNRIPWHHYFMKIAFLVAERSTCLRRKVGAVAVKENRILATGYNGAPSKLEHCLNIGCLRESIGVPSGERHELCRGLHAEQNIIIQAAVYGISLKDADIYCTHQPCLICSKMLINCQIKNIFYVYSYPDPIAQSLLDEAKIPLIKLDVE